MASKDEFKLFVKENSKLIKYVNSGEMTWQKFYEMFDLYGSKNEAWNKYLNTTETATASAATAVGITDMVSWLKNVNLDGVQNGVNSIQRVIGLLQDFSKKDTSSTKEEYKPRPIYKHFED